MELPIGCVVKSIAGRDGGRFFAVLSTDGEFALIADGKLRKVEKPKRKKLKHLRKTNTVIAEDELTTNKRIRQALYSFNQEENQ